METSNPDPLRVITYKYVIWSYAVNIPGSRHLAEKKALRGRGRFLFLFFFLG